MNSCAIALSIHQWQQDIENQLTFQSTRTQQGIVNHVFAVCHTNQENIVQTVDTVNLRQELVDDGIRHTRTVLDGSTLFANGIHFVQNDNVQHGIITHFQLFFFGVGKEVTNLLFTATDKLVENFGSSLGNGWKSSVKRVSGRRKININQLCQAMAWRAWYTYHQLGFTGVQGLANLTGNQGFSTTGWSIQEHSTCKKSYSRGNV